MINELQFTHAAEARRLAEEVLIPQYHLHLLDAQILYWFVNKELSGCGVSKLDPIKRYLASGQRNIDEGADFLVQIEEPVWMDLTSAQRLAYVDHRLRHLRRVERITNTGIEGRWAIEARHSVEEWPEIVARHGLWRDEAQDLAAVIRQLPLDLQEPSGINTLTIRRGDRSMTDEPFQRATLES